MTMLSEDDITLAGEYVLGLLDAAGEATASARMATDADFAAEVEAWRMRLRRCWRAMKRRLRISGTQSEQRLPAPTGQDVGAGKLLFWRTLTGISVGAAAILGILLLQKPDAVAPPAPEAPLIAALGSETGNASLTASYDASSGRMIVTPVSLDTGELYPELWIIPADGTRRDRSGLSNRTTATVDDRPCRHAAIYGCRWHIGDHARAASRRAWRQSHRPGHRQRQNHDYLKFF